jgi:hypothetical protein
MSSMKETRPALQRLRLLKPVEYAREVHPRGAQIVVDGDTAARLIAGARAVPAGPLPLFATCRQCRNIFEVDPRIPPGGWVQCTRPGCPFGWHR